MVKRGLLAGAAAMSLAALFFMAFRLQLLGGSDSMNEVYKLEHLDQIMAQQTEELRLERVKSTNLQAQIVEMMAARIAQLEDGRHEFVRTKAQKHHVDVHPEPAAAVDHDRVKGLRANNVGSRAATTAAATIRPTLRLESLGVDDVLADVFREFAADGIQAALQGGSALGARRHFGWIPNFAKDSQNYTHTPAMAKQDGIAGDKDFDIVVLDATSDAVLKALRRVRTFTDGTACYVRAFGFQCDLGSIKSRLAGNDGARVWLDLWMYGRIDFDGLDKLADAPGRRPPKKWQKGGILGQHATLEQAMGITDRSAYVCLGHLRRPGAKQKQTVYFDKVMSQIGTPWSKRVAGALPNGVRDPLGSCTEWFNVNFAVDSRRWRWGWLGVQRTDLGNENMFPTPVVPASVFLPRAFLPFGIASKEQYTIKRRQGEVAQPWDGHVFPVPGQIDLYLDIWYGTTWNTTCGGWLVGTTPCSNFHQTSPFVSGIGITSMRTDERSSYSEQLSLQIGDRALYSFRFDLPRASKDLNRLLQQLDPVGRAHSCCRRFK